MNLVQRKLIALLVPLIFVILTIAITYNSRDDRTFYFALYVALVITLYIESWLWKWDFGLESMRKALILIVPVAGFLITGAIISQPYVTSIHIHSSKLNILAWFRDDCEKEGKWKDIPTICTQEGLKVNGEWNLEEIRERFHGEIKTGVFGAGYEQSYINGSKGLVDHPPEGQTIKLRKEPFGSDAVWYWLITFLLAGFIEYRLLSGHKAT